MNLQVGFGGFGFRAFKALRLRVGPLAWGFGFRVFLLRSFGFRIWDLGAWGLRV